MHVGVDADPRLVEAQGDHEIGRLAADAAELQQLVDGVGDAPAVLREEVATDSENYPRFRAVEADGIDEPRDPGRRERQQALRCVGDGEERAAAGPVVVSSVRSDRMQAMSTRNGSPASANCASAVGFQADRVRWSRRITAAMSSGRGGRREGSAARAAIGGTLARRSRSVNDEDGGRRATADWRC